MANKQFPLARNAALYINTSKKLIGDTGVETAQSWLLDGATQVTGVVRNLTANMSDILADTNTRNSTAGGFQSQTPVLHSMEVTFDTPWDVSSDDINDFLTAWQGFERRGFAVLNRIRDVNQLANGDIINGIVGNFWIEQSWDQQHEDIQRANWTIRHSDQGVYYYEVYAS